MSLRYDWSIVGVATFSETDHMNPATDDVTKTKDQNHTVYIACGIHPSAPFTYLPVHPYLAIEYYKPLHAYNKTPYEAHSKM